MKQVRGRWTESPRGGKEGYGSYLQSPKKYPLLPLQLFLVLLKGASDSLGVITVALTEAGAARLAT